MLNMMKEEFWKKVDLLKAVTFSNQPLPTTHPLFSHHEFNHYRLEAKFQNGDELRQKWITLDGELEFVYCWHLNSQGQNVCYIDDLKSLIASKCGQLSEEHVKKKIAHFDKFYQGAWPGVVGPLYEYRQGSCPIPFRPRATSKSECNNNAIMGLSTFDYVPDTAL